MASNRIWRDKKGKNVILDSSAIMMLFEFSIDLEEELTRLLGKYHIIVPSPIVKELENLSKKEPGNKRMKAKASLKMIKSYDVVNVKNKIGDESVIELATQINGVVVTNDKELKQKLKEMSISVVFLRGKNKLEIE